MAWASRSSSDRAGRVSDISIIWWNRRFVCSRTDRMSVPLGLREFVVCALDTGGSRPSCRCQSVNPLARLRTRVRSEEEHVLPPRPGRAHHAFAEAELHL